LVVLAYLKLGEKSIWSLLEFLLLPLALIRLFVLFTFNVI
jgi:hypothetical protein